MKLIMEELNRIDQASRNRMQERATVSVESSSEQMQVEQTSHTQPEGAGEPSGTKPAPEPAEPPPPVEIPSVKETEAPPPEVSNTGPAALESAPPPPVERSLEERASEPTASEDAPGIPEPDLMQMSEPSPEEEPSAAPPTEEITTEALASLYILQGHYEKGIAIYRRLLAKDPGNQILFRKLEETVELAKLLSEGPQIKSGPKPPPEIPSPASPPAPASPEPAPETDREHQKTQKIQRLQLWLDSIKKGQAR